MNKKGFTNIILTIALVIVLTGGIGYWFLAQKQNVQVAEPTSCPNSTAPKSPSDICAGTYVPDAYDENGCVSGWRCTKPIPVY